VRGQLPPFAPPTTTLMIEAVGPLPGPLLPNLAVRCFNSAFEEKTRRLSDCLYNVRHGLAILLLSVELLQVIDELMESSCSTSPTRLLAFVYFSM
jgi:hypothetical protein